FFRLAPLPNVRLPDAAPRASAGMIPPLTLSAATTRSFTETERNDFIAIHPGSGSPRKNWPAANWRQLIARLRLPASLVLGDAELSASSGWTPAMLMDDRADSGKRPGDRSLHLVNRPLEVLVHHFARCRLFLGHDSGISHLAAACGARCVLLFGPTEPAMWAPPAPNVRVLRRDPDLASLSVDDVRRAVEEALADQT
ncbi:MAG: glycosyltransferase family 9 protein, partial [Opitutaceae bacterium]